MDRERFEALQHELNPHREEELRAAMMETADRLRRRGVKVSARERPEELAELLSAIERFETEVQARGGDLMVDDARTQEPDDPHFVIPSRKRGENTPAYIARIEAARQELLNHPYRRD
jgi:hypothetical protein